MITKGLKRCSGIIKIYLPLDKMGKCDRCKVTNVLVHQNVWLLPKYVYLCPKCTDKWHIIYTTSKNGNVEQAFKDFTGKTEGFIFR